MDYQNYFDLLENHNTKNIKKKEDKCFNYFDHEFVIDQENNIEVCTYCGETKKYIEGDEPINHLNNKYHLTSMIVGGKNCRNNYVIKKLHKYNNYDYKEVTMNKSFKEIKKICDHFKLSNKIYNNSVCKYKNIFLDQNISSRDNIKKSVYIYCIVFSCDYNNIEIDVDNLINYLNLKRKHYIKALKKLDKNNTYFVKDLVESKIQTCLENNIVIDKKIIYNDYHKYIVKNLKINKNSLILFLFYINLDIKNESFIEIFNTTKITVKKFNKILNVENNVH